MLIKSYLLKMVRLSDILLSYEVGINLFVEILLLLLLSIAFINTLYILKRYKRDSATELQYSLEKKSYLILSIIQISLIIKIILLPFFTYTLDKLSNIIPGAMCGAGVVSANTYGEPLIVLKIFLIITTMLWLTLNREDLHTKESRYFKHKMWFFIIIYIFILLEMLLELLFYTNLSTVNPVSCCSTLYTSTQDSNPLPFNISILQLISSFYLIYLALVLSAYYKKRFLFLSLCILFTYISYLSLVYFFSTYIYQLPTHKCPYCLLQSDYYYIGYFIYSSYILALFTSMSAVIYTFTPKSFNISILFYSLFLFFVSINYILYLIINRTLL